MVIIYILSANSSDPEQLILQVIVVFVFVQMKIRKISIISLFAYPHHYICWFECKVLLDEQILLYRD